MTRETFDAFVVLAAGLIGGFWLGCLFCACMVRLRPPDWFAEAEQEHRRAAEQLRRQNAAGCRRVGEGGEL